MVFNPTVVIMNIESLLFVSIFLIPLTLHIPERDPVIEAVSDQAVLIGRLDNRVSVDAEHTEDVRVEFLVSRERVLHLLEADRFQPWIGLHRYHAARSTGVILVARLAVHTHR